MTTRLPGASVPEGVKHGNYVYRRFGCRCEICRADAGAIRKAARDRLNASRPPKPKQPRKVSPKQTVEGTISKPRELRILSREEPVLLPTFVATPVDDCGELISRGRWCTHKLPCPHHPEDGVA